MQRDLQIRNTEADVDVFVRRVVAGLDGVDIVKDTIEDVVDHVIGKGVAYQHDIVNENALHIFFVVISSCCDGARSKERIFLDQVVAARSIDGNDDHVIAEGKLGDCGVRKAGGDERRVTESVLHLIDRLAIGKIVDRTVLVSHSVSFVDHAGVQLNAGVRSADADSLALEVLNGFDTCGSNGDQLHIVRPQSHYSCEIRIRSLLQDNRIRRSHNGASYPR